MCATNAAGTVATWPARLLWIRRLLRASDTGRHSADVFLCHFHVPEPFRPDHHIWTESAQIKAAAPDNPNLSLQIALLGAFAQFFNDFFGAAVAARGTRAISVLDTYMDVPDLRRGLRIIEPPCIRFQ